MLNAATMETSSNIIDLGYAVVDFDNETIAWAFQGYSAKREKAIRAAFKVFMIDSDLLRAL
jgi:hypothetical protein